MHLTTRTTFLASLLLLSLPSLLAQTAVDPTGHWEGIIQAPDMEVKIEIDLTRNSSGELAGAFGSRTEKLKGLPLSNFAVEGNSIRFQIKGTPGERAFKCILSADAKSMSGDFTQSGYTIPFTLSRTGEPRFEAPIKNAPIGQELEGVWNGTLEANGKKLRAVLAMSNQSDGTATGNIVSVDEGLDIPIAAILQNGASLKLDLKAVGASYSGVLSADASELAGTYTQGSLVLPLTFRRAAATEGKK